MLGAIIGDIVGSVHEYENMKSKDFQLFARGSRFTDDTVMTIAVAEALLNGGTADNFIDSMKKFGRLYPKADYGGQFGQWVVSDDRNPYNSFGNGSAMRVAPCAWYAKSLEEAEQLAELSASVTHNHPEGIKGAKATAAAIYLARVGKEGTAKTKAGIKDYIQTKYGYDLNRTLDEIRPSYQFNETCQETVPEAIVAYLESRSFDDAIRNAVSLGGDADTLAAIAGSVAEGQYGIRHDTLTNGIGYMDEELSSVVNAWLDRGLPTGGHLAKSYVRQDADYLWLPDHLTEPHEIKADIRISETQFARVRFGLWSKPHEIKADIRISETQFARVRFGLWSKRREDKWFIYFENGRICCRRSLTGIKIYEAEVQKCDTGYIVPIITVERDTELYRCKDDAKDTGIFRYLLGEGILGASLDAQYGKPKGMDRSTADQLSRGSQLGRVTVTSPSDTSKQNGVGVPEAERQEALPQESQSASDGHYNHHPAESPSEVIHFVGLLCSQTVERAVFEGSPKYRLHVVDSYEGERHHRPENNKDYCTEWFSELGQALAQETGWSRMHLEKVTKDLEDELFRIGNPYLDFVRTFKEYKERSEEVFGEFFIESVIEFSDERMNLTVQRRKWIDGTEQYRWVYLERRGEYFCPGLLRSSWVSSLGRALLIGRFSFLRYARPNILGYDLREQLIQICERYEKPDYLDSWYSTEEPRYYYATFIYELSKAIDKDPNDCEAYLRRGLSYSQRYSSDCQTLRFDDYNKAVSDFGEAIRINPSYIQAYCARAHAYEDMGDFEHALADYSEAIRLAPNNWIAYFNRGVYFYNRAEYDRAISDFTKAERIGGIIGVEATLFLYRGIASVKLGDGHYRDAETDLYLAGNAVHEVAWNSGGPIYELAEIYLYNDIMRRKRDGSGDRSYINELIELGDKLIELGDSEFLAYAHLSRGMSRCSSCITGKTDWGEDPITLYKDVFKDLSRAVRLEPQFADTVISKCSEIIALDHHLAAAYKCRGVACLCKDNAHLAAADFDAAIKKGLHTPSIYGCMGLAKFKMGHYEAAIDEFTNAISQFETHAGKPKSNAYFDRGRAYMAIGNYGCATSDFTKAIELAPNSSLYYLSRGIAYKFLKEYLLAIEDFNRAIELNPRNNPLIREHKMRCDSFYTADYHPDVFNALLHRGNAHLLNGVFGLAIEDCTEVIELNPNCRKAYQIRGMAYICNGDKKDSDIDFATAVELDDGQRDPHFVGMSLTDRSALDELRRNSKNVYAAGESKLYGKTIATVWKNGSVLYSLEDTRDAKFLSIFVTDQGSCQDVYVVGNEHGQNTHSTAVVWKNGQVLYHLGDGSNPTEAKSIYISANDVYVAGHECFTVPKSKVLKTIATVWKNGQVYQRLSVEMQISAANSIFVTGEDIYVVGWGREHNSKRLHNAFVWKNGQLHWRLDEGDGAGSVFVSGQDVYVVGYGRSGEGGTTVILWKNGQVHQHLRNGGRHSVFPSSVFVSGNTVYVAGWESRKGSKKRLSYLWKSGTVQQEVNVLEESFDGYLNSLFVHGDDVYLAGEYHSQEDMTDLVWKNGRTHWRLHDTSAIAYSIFVTGCPEVAQGDGLC